MKHRDNDPWGGLDSVRNRYLTKIACLDKPKRHGTPQNANITK